MRLKQDEALAHERFMQQKADRTAAEEAARSEWRQMEDAMLEALPDGDDEHLERDSNAIVDMVRAGKLDEAEAAAHALLERYPYVYDGYDRLGMVEEARGNHTAAAVWYRKCLAFAQAHRQHTDPAIEERYQAFIERLDPSSP